MQSQQTDQVIQRDYAHLPLVLNFMKESPFWRQFAAEIDGEQHVRYDEELQLNVCADGTPVALPILFGRTPTSAYTPGRTRPGYRNKNGKWLPSKWIPGRTDRRAGR